MRRDIQNTDDFQRISRRFADWYRPGSGEVVDLVDPALSPDARTVAAAGVMVERLEGLPGQKLCLIDVATGELNVVSDSPRQDRLPKWSPDGRHIAFLSDRTAAFDFQLQVMDVASRTMREFRLADHWAEYLQWSPDGGRVLVGVAGTGADMAGAQGGFASPLGKEEAPAWAPEIDAGVKDSQWRSVVVCDIASGAFTRVTPAGLQVWEAAWCGPDKLICVASDTPGEEAWYSADLRQLDLGSGAVRSLYTPADQIGWISASPSGARIAFAEAVCSDRTIVAGVLKVGDAGGFEDVDTAGADVTFTAWQGEDALLHFGHRAFETVAGLLEKGARRELWSSDQVSFGDGRYASGGPGARPGVFTAVVEGYVERPILTLFDDSGAHDIRALGHEQTCARIAAAGSARPYRWTAPDGLEIHGWLITPTGPGPHPLILDVHGGPVWAYRPRFLGKPGYPGHFLEASYAVLQPNVRGSSGRGQDYARRVFGDMGGADTHDYLSGVDQLVADKLADPTRLGVTGGSYGGFMSSWLITQDQRFAAAAPIAPVTNWVSEHLTCHIPHFCEMFLADEMTNAGGKYFSRSPIMHASRVSTPTLNICGALDHNTPPGQALEFHHALLLHGVESVLLTYPQEGHGVRNMPAAIDFGARLLGWFETHMPAGRQADQ